MYTQAVSTQAPNQIKSTKKEMKSEDFIKMMIAQLQSQDPMEPTKNSDLMAQISQISQLQSNTSLQQTLKSVATQDQIGAAANLIGKTVEGLDENKEKVSGLVTRVRVQENKVYLELDTGRALPLEGVTSITPPSAEYGWY